MPLSRYRDLKLATALAVAAAISIGPPDAPIETAAQSSPTNTLTHNGKTYPPQSLAMPVNDLPAPYERVHPWGETPYDAANYDARASFIGAAEGPDGNIYGAVVRRRCWRSTSRNGERSRATDIENSFSLRPPNQGKNQRCAEAAGAFGNTASIPACAHSSCSRAPPMPMAPATCPSIMMGSAPALGKSLIQTEA